MATFANPGGYNDKVAIVTYIRMHMDGRAMHAISKVHNKSCIQLISNVLKLRDATDVRCSCHELA
jgi:hypothetical protein